MREESNSLRWLLVHATMWLAIFALLGVLSLRYVRTRGFEGLRIEQGGEAINISRDTIGCRETWGETILFACDGVLSGKPLRLSATLPQRNWLLATCELAFNGRQVSCGVGNLTVAGRFYVVTPSDLGLPRDELQTLRASNWPLNIPELWLRGLATVAALALALHVGLLLARKLEGNLLLQVTSSLAAGAGIFVLLFWSLLLAVLMTGYLD